MSIAFTAFNANLFNIYTSFKALYLLERQSLYLMKLLTSLSKNTIFLFKVAKRMMMRGLPLKKAGNTPEKTTQTQSLPT